MKHMNQRAKHALRRAIRNALKHAELSTAALVEIEGMPDEMLGALFKHYIRVFQAEARKRPRASKSHRIAAVQSALTK
jgi:hypothetical protein